VSGGLNALERWLAEGVDVVRGLAEDVACYVARLDDLEGMKARAADLETRAIELTQGYIRLEARFNALVRCVATGAPVNDETLRAAELRALDDALGSGRIATARVGGRR